MKIIKLAAGFAVGYVLGSRAGRDAYERIAVNARQLREHPTVRQAQEKTKAMVSSGIAATDTTATGRKRPAPKNVAVAAPVEPAVGQPLS